MCKEKYECDINLYIECESRDAVDKLRELFAVKSGGKIIQMVPVRENTKIEFPIFHDLSTADSATSPQYSCCIEGHTIDSPNVEDFKGFIAGITHGNSGVIGCVLRYVCLSGHGYGTWQGSRDEISLDYLNPDDWPSAVACAGCDRFDSMEESDSDSYYRPCNDCVEEVKDMFRDSSEHLSCWDHVCLNFAITEHTKNNKEFKEEPKMDMDNIDRPKLEVSKDRMKQIYDAIENISCINDDIVSKLGKAPEMLKQVVHLADCLMAIWHGEAGNELSDIDEVSDSIDVINRASCDLADAMRNIGAELIND